VSVDRLSLALGLSSRLIRQEINDAEQLRVAEVGVQCQHHRGTFPDDPHAGVTVAVDPTLMPLGEAKPPLQVEVVLHSVDLVPTGEEAGAEAVHQTGHLLVRRVIASLQSREDRLERGAECLTARLECSCGFG
jgi:hypothetical protein